MEEIKKKRFAVPHVYILLLALIFVCSFLTYIIPAGAYDMVTLESGREVVDASTYHAVDPVSYTHLLKELTDG